MLTKQRLVLLALLLLIAAPAYAQSSSHLVATLSDDAASFVDTDKLVWLDSDMLLFEPPSVQMNEFYADQYSVSTGKVTRIDPSPFFFAPTSERISFYQMDQTYLNSTVYDSFRSPFPSGESALHDVIYLSSLSIACGQECPNGIIMAGTTDDSSDDHMMGTYHPLDFFTSGRFHVHWARKAAVAIVDVPYPTGSGSRLYAVNLQTGAFGQSRASIFIADMIAELGSHCFAVSDDGASVLYSAPGNSPDKTILHLWQNASPTQTFSSGAQGTFFAANFIPNDSDHVLALDSDGIVRVDLKTGKFTVLNPAINAQSIRLGVFSPDNQHIAVLTNNANVEVLDTGIG